VRTTLEAHWVRRCGALPIATNRHLRRRATREGAGTKCSYALEMQAFQRTGQQHVAGMMVTEDAVCRPDRSSSGVIDKPMKSLGIVLVLACVAAFAQREDDIGYPTVQAALDALRTVPGARFSMSDGWTVVDLSEGVAEVRWSFTPSGHPAHPSAVKRTITDRGDEVSTETRVRCEAAKTPCDRLFEEVVKAGEQVPRNPKKSDPNKVRP